jgi:flagellar basal-body rod modification protein FlgD
MAVTATGTTGNAISAASSSGARLAGNFDNFLTLLTTQLKNQSPTDPLDTNQMTAQLVQFASVEQQISMNKNLEQMVSLQQAAQLTAAAPLMGQKVEVEGDGLPLQNGSATLRLPAAGTARMARVAVMDSSGKIVREAQVQLGATASNWNWDGRDGNGTKLTDGAYKVAVTGSDAYGGSAAMRFTVIGTATGAERQDGTLRLRLGGATYGFDKVRSIAPAS